MHLTSLRNIPIFNEHMFQMWVGDVEHELALLQFNSAELQLPEHPRYILTIAYHPPSRMAIKCNEVGDATPKKALDGAGVT
jgi:hypothetical protein